MQEICAVIAAGGLGTRLKNYKNNFSTKVLIEIGSKSMISSQVSQISSWGIKNFVIITNPDFDLMIKEDVVKNHSEKNIKFIIQEKPLGIAHALLQAEKLVENYSKILFVLGDNFFGENPMLKLENRNIESMIFLKKVLNPNEFGVAKILNNNLIDIEEKPDTPSSDLAVVGLYLYSLNCFELIKKLKFSQRGELEISDLNNELIKTNSIQFEILDSWWIDAGTEERIEELKKLIL
jgi:glucose-1-phosphate thymidylyltransferase